MAAWETGTHLRTLVAQDPEITKKVSAKDLDHVFDPATHFRDVARTFKGLGL
jgi:adenylosuccinate lyase